MKTRKIRKLSVAIAGGLTLLASGFAFSYWHFQQKQWCVQFTSSGGQEVTYSRGCHSPQRYKKWTLTASVPIDRL